MATAVTENEIHSLTFVPASMNNAMYWHKELHYFMRLCGDFEGHVVITFATTRGEHIVETVILNIADNAVEITSNVAIPLKSIIQARYKAKRKSMILSDRFYVVLLMLFASLFILLTIWVTKNIYGEQNRY